MEVATVDVARQAEAFARKKFAAMRRPNKAQEPKFNHMREVAHLVNESGGTDEEVAAAWLHDVVEDTDTPIGEIADKFGLWIATLVQGLTDEPAYADFGGLKTLERKRLQAAKIAAQPDSVRKIKLADQISNLRSVAYDPPTTWNKQKILDYIQGAKMVCETCLGISALLDDYFSEAYEAAIQSHSY